MDEQLAELYYPAMIPDVIAHDPNRVAAETSIEVHTSTAEDANTTDDTTDYEVRMILNRDAQEDSGIINVEDDEREFVDSMLSLLI